jgi:hypothetical protein
MISYWVTREGSFGIAAYQENRGRAIADRFRTLVYDDIEHVVRFPAGTQIFSALDRLTDGQREAAASIWDAHARAVPSATRLNDPRRVLLRFQLLEALRAENVNSYRVFRATDLKSLDTFPVFVRHMYDHSGPKTGLLTTRRDVVRALLALRLRGYRLRDLMIVEFCDTSIQDGLFRKFSAFKVGGAIIPSHFMASHHWCVKSGWDEPTEERIREGMRFVEENPHKEWLRRVFSIGGIDYGRVDYGVLNGVPQVWEINLNPTIGRGSGWPRGSDMPARIKDLREKSRQAFHIQLRDAFVALDAESREPDIRVTFDDALVARLQREAAARTRRARVLRTLSGLSRHRRAGLPVRAALKLFPRW